MSSASCFSLLYRRGGARWQPRQSEDPLQPAQQQATLGNYLCNQGWGEGLWCPLWLQFWRWSWEGRLCHLSLVWPSWLKGRNCSPLWRCKDSPATQNSRDHPLSLNVLAIVPTDKSKLGHQYHVVRTCVAAFLPLWGTWCYFWHFQNRCMSVFYPLVLTRDVNRRHICSVHD